MNSKPTIRSGGNRYEPAGAAVRHGFRMMMILTVVASVGVGLSQSAAAGTEEMNVVVTTKPIHSLVAQVMEGVASPHLLVEGSASAHTFTLKPSAISSVARGGVLIRVSPRTEPFTVKLVDSLAPEVTVLTLAEQGHGIKLLPQRHSAAFEAHHHEGEDHADGHDGERASVEQSFDGHIWLDPSNARAAIRAVATALSLKWPSHAAQFNANAARAEEALTAFEAEISSEIATLRDKPYVVFHDAYQYFEVGFGLPAAGAITLSPDQPPSAQRLTEIREKIRNLGAACIFAEPGFQPKLLAAVSEGISVRAGSLDPEGQDLPPGPDLYVLLMRGLVRDLHKCLDRL